jgi:hypothetical protein
MKKYCFIYLLLASLYSYGQDTGVLKRTPYKLSVAVDKTSFYEEDIQSTAFVLPDKTIQVYPGETIFVEVEVVDGVVKNITAVKEIKNPSITLTISFTQTAKNKVHELMMLKIENPFPKKLLYKAGIYLFKQKKWVGTSVYPVEAGLSGFETWPDIIISIALKDWKFESK